MWQGSRRATGCRAGSNVNHRAHIDVTQPRAAVCERLPPRESRIHGACVADRLQRGSKTVPLISDISRRLILRAAAFGIAGSAGVLDAVAQTPLAATPVCDDGDDPTPAQTAGPYFKPRSPLRTSFIEEGITGTRLSLSGTVLTRGCRPVPGALIDLWHADANGAYDNTGYRLRGHQFTDNAGRYRFETIVPGRYPGRTPHFHLRAQPRNGRILTTQLYFPDEAQNRGDRIFNPALLMRLNRSGSGIEARFDIVLA